MRRILINTADSLWQSLYYEINLYFHLPQPQIIKKIYDEFNIYINKKYHRLLYNYIHKIATKIAAYNFIKVGLFSSKVSIVSWRFFVQYIFCL